jgi:hypothetical protein
MKFGVGKKGGYARKLIILITALIIISLFDVFGITVLHDEGSEISYETIESPEDSFIPEFRGVRSGKPAWSPLSGSLPIGNDYYGINFGDVNNDGNLDVVVATGINLSEGVKCWVGDGNGGWTEQSTGLPTTNWYTDVEIDDLNRDGKMDVVVGGYLWTGDGGAGGEMDWALQAGVGYSNGIALGDIDNNGTVDIAAGTNDGVKVWASDGGEGGVFDWTDSSGTLPSSGQYFGVYFGDVNNDGKLDLAAGSNNDTGVQVWTGNGESGSKAVWTDISTGLPIDGNYSQVCFGDANNDGKLDLAASSLSQGVRFWRGDGGSSWIEESNGLSVWGKFLGLDFGDVNNDGKLDLVGANYSGGGIEVWLGDGGDGGTMDWTSAREGLPDNIKITDICLGDVNNDGRLDIGAATFSSGVQIWAGNLPDLSIMGWTSASSGLPSGSSWYDVTFGDINHDGYLDLAAAANIYGSGARLGVKVWLGDGGVSWTESSDPDLPSSGGFNGVRLVDMNHDGNLDLVTANDTDSGVCVFLGDGAGDFGPNTGTTDPPSPPPMGGLEVGDINNDGNLDIASCYYEPPKSGDKVYAWLGDGNGSWGGDIGPPMELGFDDVALGDVDHDGDLDLFATGHMQGFRFWVGDGNGGWTWDNQNGEGGIPASGGGGLGACFGDVDHDGNQDIAVGSWAGGYGMRVYTSDGGEGGDINWTEESSGLPTSGNYAGVELGDINNDGDLDLLSASCWGTDDGISLRLGNGGEGGSMLWTDALLPDLPSTGSYWGVAYGDVNCDGVLDIAITSASGVWVYITQTQPSYQIDLEEGWNLISLPLMQTNTSVDAVFSSIDGQYNAVYRYNVSDNDDSWKLFHTSKPGNLWDLSKVNHTMGIWIYITQPGGTTMTVYGDQILTSQSILLQPGWNLVGYPKMINLNRTEALNNLDFGTDVNSIWTFYSNDQAWKELGESDYFETGKGYWIYANTTCVWEITV